MLYIADISAPDKTRLYFLSPSKYPLNCTNPSDIPNVIDVLSVFWNDVGV